MSHDQDSRETLNDRPGIAVIDENISDIAVTDSDVKEAVTYPPVSVIITTYLKSRWEWLTETINSAQDQIVPALEIIVVVDHNQELQDDISREFPGVICVPNIGDRGVSGARNSGVKASRGEVVAFLDDDAIATPDWLATLLRHIVTPGVVGAGCSRAGLREDPGPKGFPGEVRWA